MIAGGVLALLFLMGWPYSADANVVTTTYATAQDSSIRQDSQILNYGATTQITVQSQSGSRNRRGAVAFNISAIPASSTVESALLRIYLQTVPAVQRTINVNRLTQSWLEGTGNGVNNSAAINGVTWWERQFGNNLWTGAGPWDWTAQGSDFIAAPTASTTTPAAVGWMNWNVLPDVGAWVSGAAVNYGWLMKDSAEDSATQRRSRYASRENANPALDPALDVTYLLAASTLSTATVQVGWYGQLGTTFTNNGGAGADQVHQVSFLIPAGWSNISTATAAYTVTAPAGKTWNVTGVPSGTAGPQTVTVTAANGASDLANGQTISITFNAMAPWMSGNSLWPFTVYGAAGGSNAPQTRTINVTGATLDLISSIDTSFAPITLSGADTSLSGSFGLMEVRDGRGTGGGWNVALSSTDFALQGNPSVKIPAAGFYVPTPPAITVVNGSLPPVGGAGLLAGVGLTVLNATPGRGMGQYRATPGLELLVPADTLTGTYEATVTQTLIGL